jgi:hypothetical protein
MAAFFSILAAGRYGCFGHCFSTKVVPSIAPRLPSQRRLLLSLLVNCHPLADDTGHLKESLAQAYVIVDKELAHL